MLNNNVVELLTGIETSPSDIVIVAQLRYMKPICSLPDPCVECVLAPSHSHLK